MTRIETYSIGELARASGVSVRALHHYDAVGLLCPLRAAANGYRVYTRADALRLQEILYYRAAGMPLAEISALLAGDDPVSRLARHRARLAAGQARTARMIATLDRTLAELKGQPAMPIDSLYTPFDDTIQAEYETWLVEIYRLEMAARIAASKAHLDRVPDGMDARMAALRGIEAALVATYEAGTPPEAADLEAHRGWVGEMWGRPCTREAHAGLAEVYLAHPDFIARYEALSPGFSQWLTTAMKAAV